MFEDTSTFSLLINGCLRFKGHSERELGLWFIVNCIVSFLTNTHQKPRICIDYILRHMAWKFKKKNNIYLARCIFCILYIPVFIETHIFLYRYLWQRKLLDRGYGSRGRGVFSLGPDEEPFLVHRLAPYPAERGFRGLCGVQLFHRLQHTVARLLV